MKKYICSPSLKHSSHCRRYYYESFCVNDALTVVHWNSITFKYLS